MFEVGDLVRVRDNLQPQQKVYSGMVGVITGMSSEFSNTSVRINLSERCAKKKERLTKHLNAQAGLLLLTLVLQIFKSFE